MRAVLPALLLLAAASRCGVASIALDNGLARTPMMGWNSWNSCGGNLDEDKMRATIDLMVDLGLADLGYSYFNLDDGWSEPARSAEGRLLPNAAAFPGGIKPLADYAHQRGLKFGIYADAGRTTCLGFPGSRGHESADAATFAAWGVDYLKYDNCAADDGDAVVERYTAMRDALNATGRPCVFSLCEWGIEAPWLWAAGVGHSWRTTVDVGNNWNSVLANLDSTVGLARFAGPGGWNDPDMLEVGNGGLTPGQERAQFALWALLKAPLLVGADLRAISPDSLAVLKAEDVIAVSQDALGVAGELVWKQGPREVYAAPLAGGARAVVLLNRHLLEYQPTRIQVRWSEVGLPEGAAAVVRDLFGRRELGQHVGGFTAEVRPMDVVALRITPTAAVEGADDWRPWHGQRMFEAHSDGGAARGGEGAAELVRLALHGVREQPGAAAA